MYNIGEKIKELRKKNDLTQEKLADYLGVSYQAVSKWETGVCSPDLSLIGPLTKLLHVSADELLGLNKPVTDARHDELTAAIEETWKTGQDGDLEKRYGLLKTAVAEYPGDMKFLCDFAWATGMRSFSFEDNETYYAEQNEAIRLFARVIEDCDKTDIRCTAIGGIVQYLGFRGRHEEAKKYAEMYPDDPPYRKDAVIADSLTGEEREKHEQKMLQQTLGTLLNGLNWWSIPTCHAILGILKVFHPDGEYRFYLGHLAATKRQLGILYAREGKYDLAVRYLREAKEHSYANDEIEKHPQVYRFASPFFAKAEFNPGEFVHTGDDSAGSAFYEVLERKEFDPIREREDFQSLLTVDMP